MSKNIRKENEIGQELFEVFKERGQPPTDHKILETMEKLSFTMDELKSTQKKLDSRNKALETAHNLLKQKDNLFNQIFDQSPLGVALLSPDCRFKLVNSKFCHITGYTEEELASMGFADITHPEDRSISQEYYERSLEVEREPFEIRFLHKKGDLIWGWVSSSLVRDTDGIPLYFISLIQDITQNKLYEGRVGNSIEKLRKAMGGIIQAMSLTVEARDPYTSGHQRRVADLARSIAQKMGLSENQVDGLRMAANVHDLGKIAVPAEILSKPTKLNSLEFQLIKIHPQTSYDILKDIDFPWPVAQIVFQHHERINGSGYPLGLSGEDICLEARILAVADVVEAISSHRPSRPALGIDKALEEISTNKGILYDRDVVDACLRLFYEKGYIF
ncbi:MAG: PAS domain S-box protein [Deltaproteobacteria bacterium]|nr:PAS domain S-box protein [Deltaproteobacteria bacterium]